MNQQHLHRIWLSSPSSNSSSSPFTISARRFLSVGERRVRSWVSGTGRAWARPPSPPATAAAADADATTILGLVTCWWVLLPGHVACERVQGGQVRAVLGLNTIKGKEREYSTRPFYDVGAPDGIYENGSPRTRAHHQVFQKFLRPISMPAVFPTVCTKTPVCISTLPYTSLNNMEEEEQALASRCSLCYSMYVSSDCTLQVQLTAAVVPPIVAATTATHDGSVNASRMSVGGRRRRRALAIRSRLNFYGLWLLVLSHVLPNGGR